MKYGIMHLKCLFTELVIVNNDFYFDQEHIDKYATHTFLNPSYEIYHSLCHLGLWYILNYVEKILI